RPTLQDYCDELQDTYENIMKRAISLVILTVGLLSGCGGRSAGPAADADVGEKALLTALEAWKGGKSQQDIEKGSPSIIMNEDDWRTGKRLLDFKVGEGSMDGRQVKRKVQIKLQDKDGAAVDK